MHSHDDILDSPISDKEVSCHIKNLKTNVATGIDMIANEHLIHGGKDIIDHIVRLFNLILEHEHFPPDLLKGAIIILPKSGKPPSIQKNNRGITLLSTEYKLLEKVLYERIKKYFMKINTRLCHPLKIAYQPQLCILMTSFSLQETVQHLYERASNVFCCLLDVSSAFDTVYHNGLFVKLYESGIKGKLLRILFSAYSNMKSCVMHNGLISNWFSLEQSVRQGGVLSAWLYSMIMIYSLKLRRNQLAAT